MIKFNEIQTIPNTKKEILKYGDSDVSSFLKYFSMRYEKYKDRFIVESRFLWQMYQKQTKIRMLLVEMEDGDVVYCYMKNVTIYPAIYIILMGRPISSHGNTGNEDKVLVELCQYKHIVGFEAIQEEIDYLNSTNLIEHFEIKPPYYDEYYIHTKSRFEDYLNLGKWRSKYSINKLKSNSDFVFRQFRNEDYEKNVKLVELWKSSHNKKVTKFNVTFETKSYFDILNKVNEGKLLDEYLIYNLFYKEELVGCIIFLVVKVGDIKISYQEHNINLSRKFENENQLNIDNNFFKNIGNIMFYLTTEDLIKKGIEYSYCQGVKFWSKQKSGEYKKRLNDRTIEFSKIFFKNS